MDGESPMEGGMLIMMMGDGHGMAYMYGYYVIIALR
jgi:hypothetical protein